MHVATCSGGFTNFISRFHFPLPLMALPNASRDPSKISPNCTKMSSLEKSHQNLISPTKLFTNSWYNIAPKPAKASNIAKNGTLIISSDMFPPQKNDIGRLRPDFQNSTRILLLSHILKTLLACISGIFFAKNALRRVCHDFQF